MSHDISQPVPQGGNGAQDAENSRITAIADELDRLCAIHEAQLRDSQADVSLFEVEQRAAEQMAKAGGYWIPMMDIFDLQLGAWPQRLVLGPGPRVLRCYPIYRLTCSFKRGMSSVMTIHSISKFILK